MNIIKIGLLLILIPLLSFQQNKKPDYLCMPCKQTCDLKKFNQEEDSPKCNSKLIKKGTYNKKINKKSVLEDLNILSTTLKTNHPGIYDYQNPEEFETTIEKLTSSVDASSTVLDAYKVFSELISKVSDAHTYVMHPYYQNILQEELLFPYIPEINNDKISVNGKTVKSINGKSAQDVLKLLQRYANSDGNTIPYKNAFIEMEFPLKYFTFVDTSSTFDIVFEDYSKEKRHGASYFSKGLRPKLDSPSLEFKNKKAILKIPSWEDNSAGSFNQNLKEMASNSRLGKFLSNSMNEVINSKVDTLTIDLTGNKGGKSGPAAILLSYLINKPFKYYNQIKISSDKFPTKEYITNKELVTFYESENSKSLINEINGNYYFKDEILPLIKPNNQFLGTVNILVDKYTLSVSTDVVAILKKNKQINIIGDEIGGSLYHYCAGNYLNLQLPNTKIEVNIPLQRLSY